MGKPSGKTSPAITARQKLRGSGSKLWYAVFFAVGMGLMGLGFQLARVSIHREGNSAAPTASMTQTKSKPWGDLEITPIVLERPEEMFATNNAPAPALRWLFPNYSREQVAELINSCELSPDQKASLLDTNKWEPASHGWVIWPAPGVVKDLSAAAREKIYSVLAQSRENAGPAFPFVYRKDGFEEWFSACELSPERVALVRKWAYPKKDLLCFADIQLFELLCSSNETHCLIKTLCRVPTLMMKLKLSPQSDIDGLLDYWGGCCKAKTLKPLFKSMARVGEGGDLNVSFFLPSVPRLRLYTYPDPASPVREDCFWSSFNFFSDEPDDRFINPEYADRALRSDFAEVRGEKRFGDLMLLLASGDKAVHMCVYIADDVVFTKNGGHVYQPWVLMRIKDMMVQYPPSQPQQWRVFRKKQV